MSEQVGFDFNKTQAPLRGRAHLIGHVVVVELDDRGLQLLMTWYHKDTRARETGPIRLREVE